MKKVVYFIALVLHFVGVEVVETLSELYPEATERGQGDSVQLVQNKKL